MQTLKTYIKKVKLFNPITLFKNYLSLFERLEHRVDRLENNASVDDVDNRVDNLEYDLDGRIESVEDRSETNQESIKNMKDDVKQVLQDVRRIIGVDFEGIADRFDKIDNSIDYCKEYIVENRIENVSCETFNELVDRVKRLENSTAIEHIYNDVDRLDKRLDAIEGETSTKKIREIVSEVLCDKGLSLNLLDDRVDNLEELAKKYLNAELQSVILKGPQYDGGKQERTEANLSAMQKLSFEICKYYGGDFNLDDFNNCYEIINKYDVKEGK